MYMYHVCVWGGGGGGEVKMYTTHILYTAFLQLGKHHVVRLTYSHPSEAIPEACRSTCHHPQDGKGHLPTPLHLFPAGTHSGAE